MGTLLLEIGGEIVFLVGLTEVSLFHVALVLSTVSLDLCPVGGSINLFLGIPPVGFRLGTNP